MAMPRDLDNVVRFDKEKFQRKAFGDDCDGAFIVRLPHFHSFHALRNINQTFRRSNRIANVFLSL
jgi:hypothetical protein